MTTDAALQALLDNLEVALPPRTPLEAATDDLRTTRRALHHLQRSAERLLSALEGDDPTVVAPMAVRLSEALASTAPYARPRRAHHD